MTVTNTTRKIRHDGNGVQVLFTFPFKIYDESELMVYTVDSSDVKTLKTISSDYTVSINNDTDGGSITFITPSPPTASVDVLIVRSVPQTQPTNLPVVGQIIESQIENQFDKQTMMIQEMQEELDRTLRVDIADGDAPSDLTIPNLVSGGVLTNDGSDLTWSVVAGTGDMILAANQIVSGGKTFSDNALKMTGTTGSGQVTLRSSSTGLVDQILFPDIGGTDTAVMLDLAQTITGKTIEGDTNTIRNLTPTVVFDSPEVTGTPGDTTYLRGDNKWETPSITFGYGGLYLINGATLFHSYVTFVKLTSWTAKATELNVTADFGTTNDLTIGNAGTYFVSFSMDFQSIGASDKDITFNMHVDASPSDQFNTMAEAVSGTSNRYPSVAFSGPVVLGAGAQIAIYVKSEAELDDQLLPINGHFSVVRIA